MNEYYECQNCGQVVQGRNASQQVECCDEPDFEPVKENEEDFGPDEPSGNLAHVEVW